MSSSQDLTNLIELIKALNLGTLLPSAFTAALLWKLYGFFNGLSEKLTRIETKIDALKELTPYLIKEHLEREKTKAETKPQKHNPSMEKVDWVEIIGIGFGVSDLLIFFLTFIQGSELFNRPSFWLLFLIPGVLGVLPIFVSEKTISRWRRAILSLLSLSPWVYLALIMLKIIPPFL